MEPVLVSQDVCGASFHYDTRTVSVRGPSCTEPCQDVRPASTEPVRPPVASSGPDAAADVSPPPARLAVLTALGLALVTSALSFGFIVGGSADVGSAHGGVMVMLWPPERPAARSDGPPTMDGSSVSRRRGDVARPTPVPSQTRHSLLAAKDRPTRPTPPSPTPTPAPVAEPSPREPEAPAAAPAPAAAESKCIRVRREDGRTVIARVHGGEGRDLHIIQPDGALGIPERAVFTDEPFRPATAEEIERDLVNGPFAGFKSLRLPHYVIVYQSSDDFAQRSGQVLEKLYKGLTDAFRKFEVPVREAEFPLVAVIFRTEAAFRAHKQVDPEVQAYYEIYSNRIFFYESSERDDQAPEVAALRRPQTVAHEGTHQILQNIGVHPRLAPWPAWLVEGLAEYCATPVTTKKGTNWSGLGMVNALHMATIRDLDDPLSGQVAGSSRPEHIGRKPGMPLVEYLVTKTDLTPTDYALAWAMTHYLARRRVDDFVAYLRAMSELPPLSERTSADHLDAFRRAFGKDLVRLDREIAGYLGKLKVTNHLPYYAVMFQQRVGGGLVRRAAIVSQSPSMIRQWLDTVGSPRGDTPAWEAYPFPHRTPALAAAEAWLRGQ